MIFPTELFDDIIIFLDRDTSALCSCALVCRSFHKAATPLLYKRIHVSPPKVGLAWQVVEDTLGRKPFAASRLLSHRAYVKEFTLDGYITRIRPSRQTPVPIIDRIPEALQQWQNLHTVTLTPQRATAGRALHNIVKALRHCPSLRSVTVNDYAMDNDIMPDLAELTGLRELTLLHPTGALFLEIFSWLTRLQDTLVVLHLLGNCGSLTPGILRKITPHLSNIQSLALGLSYSLDDLDIFTCLAHLSRLKSLRLRYYRHKALPSELILPALRRFTVLHTPLFSKGDANALSTWIRRISSASSLETLQTIPSDASGPSLCFDGLISHIASKHHRTLLTLQMPKAYARVSALRTLLRKCTHLQNFSLSVSFSTLKAFPILTDDCTELKTVTFDVCDNPKLVIEKREAQKIFQRVSQLRYITVNGVTWKRDWVVPKAAEGHTAREFVASLVTNVERDHSFEAI